ncbi:hypothetical protein N5923_19215 [Erwiniaceae bacterium BAC15a-03b]|uniref:DUF2231 domain-containing protein n=1 Tax=Winslowiella arboricola TaxID=2978220 RepID=A0A9J6PXQ7_9GAMM|nr:DUF2231 domain-containing protein [Winslowiella arboricola]MCU5775530.1 hypothetical protein [Winslowiella arboricola]MCU5779620.1 hypothetical protein [Winslowiella arboricola]
MKANGNRQQSALAVAIYELLNPLPLGFFVAGWIFDIIYLYSYEIFWIQGASWLIVFGLLLAIIPRLINLVQLWITRSILPQAGARVHFWANALAVVLAIVNAFIHSRDAWAAVPSGVTLSTLVVVLLSLANLQLALRQRTA